MPFIHEDFLLSNEAARRLYHEYAEKEPILDYHCHLPPQDVAQNRQFAESVRNLAGGRPLQVARHAGQRRGRALLHRGRRSRGKVPGVGAHGAVHAAQSAVSLDAPGAEALLRHRRTAGRNERAAHLGAGQRAAGRRRSAGARHPEEIPREGRLHHGRPHRRPGMPPRDRGLRAGHQGLPVLPSRQGAERASARGVQRLGGQAGGGRATPASRTLADFVDALRKRHDYLPPAWAGGFPTTGSITPSREFCTDEEAAADFRPGARRPGGHADGARAASPAT